MTERFLEVPIAQIDIPEGGRALVEEKIAPLMDSIGALGLRQPITLRLPAEQARPTVPVHKRRYLLDAGRHRLEAAKRLGWATIPAELWDRDALYARLWTIDENLMRAELSALEEAEQLAERREIWQQIDARAKSAPAEGEDAEKLAQAEPVSEQRGKGGRGRREFAADTAKKTGKSKASVNRALRRFEKLPAGTRKMIEGSAIAKSGAELDRLIALAPEEQVKAVALIQGGQAGSVREAVTLLDREIVARARSAKPEGRARAGSEAGPWERLNRQERARFDAAADAWRLMGGKAREAFLLWLASEAAPFSFETLARRLLAGELKDPGAATGPERGAEATPAEPPPAGAPASAPPAAREPVHVPLRFRRPGEDPLDSLAPETRAADAKALEAIPEFLRKGGAPAAGPEAGDPAGDEAAPDGGAPPARPHDRTDGAAGAETDASLAEVVTDEPAAPASSEGE